MGERLRYEIAVDLDGDPVVTGECDGVTMTGGALVLVDAGVQVWVAQGFWAQCKMEKITDG